MPEISRFLGIVITMYFDDHDPQELLDIWNTSRFRKIAPLV